MTPAIREGRMPRNPRYDILFEPVRIGPVTAPNRFYQVPHCSGMPSRHKQTWLRMREVKAEGGWGVINTEYCTIHPSSDDQPWALATLWDDRDVPFLAQMASRVHAHASLAGIQLWHGGQLTRNMVSKEIPLSPSGGPAHDVWPVHSRAMDKADIRALIGWQAAAARRAVVAGFDIVYCYAGHQYLPFQFISRRFNRRGDEYGGSLANRVRLLREMIEATREAVAGKAAVAVRLAVDELLGPEGVTAEEEGREIIAMLAELPDLWDVNLSYVDNDSQTARFSGEGFQERYVAMVKGLTTKPVVGVGRFTSPDVMVAQVKRGVLDLIGAARPSIADPFLPRKIDEGREDEIRECIGCNICRAHNNVGVPIHCTQNPTMGEEYRRGWHPERIAVKAGASDETVLVVGSGPAGLECAMTLGKRGYRVLLAERSRELGGRVTLEARLPGLSTWARVRDWRVGQIGKLANVEVFRESCIAADDVAGLGVQHVLIATGARWRRDGSGINAIHPLIDAASDDLSTPDDLLAGRLPDAGHVIVYDDDQFYMGGVLAELLAGAGRKVTFVTPALEVSPFTHMTDEQPRVQKRLIDLGVSIVTGHTLADWSARCAVFADIHAGRPLEIEAGHLVTVGARDPEDALYHALAAAPPAGVSTIRRIGDCEAPGAVYSAVFSGTRAARELGEEPDPHGIGYLREDL
jgi:dimethylamine/trimethylamine dehydrogenase